MLTAIVAMDPHRLIGKNGTLPWHIPEDLAFFKKTTLGHPVLMGRKTFESIGKPLPKRRNIVLTRDASWSHPGVETLQSLTLIQEQQESIFVIGGAEIYHALYDYIDEWIVSHLHQIHEGDTFLAAFESDFPTVEIIEEYADFTVKRYRRNHL